MPYGGFYPSSQSGPKPEPKCDDCKRYLEGLEKVKRSAFHWQAMAIAEEYAAPPKDDKK